MKSRWKQPMPGDVYAADRLPALCIGFDPQKMERFVLALGEIAPRAPIAKLRRESTLGRKLELARFWHRTSEKGSER